MGTARGAIGDALDVLGEEERRIFVEALSRVHRRAMELYLGD